MKTRCFPQPCGRSAEVQKNLWRLAAVLMLVPSSYGNPPNSPTPTPAPSAIPGLPAPPTPPAEVQHHAPAGVFFLTEDIAVRLTNGIAGLTAGTKVELVKDYGDTREVTDGEHTFTVRRNQLTGDLDVAAAIQKRAAANEAAVARSQNQQEAVYVKQQRDEIEFLRAHPLSTPTPPRR